MKRTRTAGLGQITAGLIVLAAVDQAYGASMTVSVSAPVVDGADIALLPADTVTDNPNNNTTAIWSDQPNQGQTFTTPANAPAYSMYGFSFLHQWSGGWDIRTLNVAVGTIDGANNFTAIRSETIPAANTPTAPAGASWYKVVLDSPLVLNANTQYAVVIGNPDGNGAVFMRGSTVTDDYTGGAAFRDTLSNGVFDNPTISLAFDRIFHIDLRSGAPPALTLTLTLSATPPTRDGADIAVLPGDPGVTTVNDNANWTAVWSDKPFQGQTFTTGPNAQGYLLSGLSLLHNYSGYTWTDTGEWSVLLGTIDGSGYFAASVANAFIPRAPTFTGGYASGDGVADWFTFTLSEPALLTPNTTYAFAVGINDPGGSGAIFVRTSDPTDYPAGKPFSDSVVGGGFDSPATYWGSDFERVFHVNLEPVITSFTVLSFK